MGRDSRQGGQRKQTCHQKRKSFRRDGAGKALVAGRPFRQFCRTEQGAPRQGHLKSLQADGRAGLDQCHLAGGQENLFTVPHLLPCPLREDHSPAAARPRQTYGFQILLMLEMPPGRILNVQACLAAQPAQFLFQGRIPGWNRGAHARQQAGRAPFPNPRYEHGIDARYRQPPVGRKEAHQQIEPREGSGYQADFQHHGHQKTSQPDAEILVVPPMRPLHGKVGQHRQRKQNDFVAKDRQGRKGDGNQRPGEGE